MLGSDGVIEANKGALAGDDIAWCDRAGFSAGSMRGGVREVNPSKQGGNNWQK